MSTAAISNHSINPALKSYFQQRISDLHQLGQMLQAGDLAGAEKAFQAIQELGQNGPFPNGDAFKISRREQDFEAVGQALKSGDLTAAKQALQQLIHSFRRGHPVLPPAAEGADTSAQATGSALSVTA